MEWEVIAPAIVSVVFILTVAGVLVLRPIALRLSEVLALYARERHSGIETDVGQIRDLLETMDARLQLMEDRQDFTDRLLGAGRDSSGGSAVTAKTPDAAEDAGGA
jgi:stringent starvation protein B